MKGRRQLMAREGESDLRTEVNEHVYLLNRSITRLRDNLRGLIRLVGEEYAASPNVVQRSDNIHREIDAIYRTMVRVRWAALGVPPAPETSESFGKDPLGGHPVNSLADAATVFVVDDDPSVRKALSRLFRSEDYRVETFPSAHKFLAALPETRPACLVLDIRMPHMGGLDLHRELTRSGAKIPILFITGHGDMDLAVQAVKVGAVDFLPKPFDDQDLLDAVHRALTSFPEWDQSPIPEFPEDSDT